MEIDLKRTVIKIQLRRFISLIVFIIVIIVLLLLSDPKEVIMGLSRYGWGIVLASVYIIVAIVEGFMDLNYIYYSDRAGKITLKFFSLSFTNRKKQFFEIPYNEFIGFKIERSLLGLRERLILIRMFRNKEANYPPVSISALSKEQKKSLIASLSKYSK